MFLSHGAKISLKNNLKQSPLHFAAKYGRYASCIQIFRSENFKLFLNEKDSNGTVNKMNVCFKKKFKKKLYFIGLTPLHLAAENDHSNVVQILMQHGALVYRSFTGDNPFHLAASSGSINCMKIIMNVDPHILNTINKDGVCSLCFDYKTILIFN